MKQIILFIGIFILLMSCGGDKKSNENKGKKPIVFKYQQVTLEDVQGADINDIPRYPGSIRYFWGNWDTVITVKYNTDDSPEQILKFYTDYMQKKKWKNYISERLDNGVSAYSFSRGSDNCNIEIDSVGINASQYSITVLYNTSNE